MERTAMTPRSDELYGPHLNAPVWPWVAAGLILTAFLIAYFMYAWWVR